MQQYSIQGRISTLNNILSDFSSVVSKVCRIQPPIPLRELTVVLLCSLKIQLLEINSLSSFTLFNWFVTTFMSILYSIFYFFIFSTLKELKLIFVGQHIVLGCFWLIMPLFSLLASSVDVILCSVSYYLILRSIGD